MTFYHIYRKDKCFTLCETWTFWGEHRRKNNSFSDCEFSVQSGFKHIGIEVCLEQLLLGHLCQGRGCLCNNNVFFESIIR